MANGASATTAASSFTAMVAGTTYVDEKTGHGALSLLAYLHHDDAEAALEAAQAWLAQHKGDGQLGRANGDGEDEEKTPRQ